MKIGILALQGGFAEHAHSLTRLGAECFMIRRERDLDREMEGLILPGGESTVMRKLMEDLGLLSGLRQRIADGLPVLGTCAGLILLAEEVEGGKACLATMGVRVKRNAYGRQLGSFHTEEDFQGIGRIPMTFIRAPYIEAVLGEGQILARADGRIVAVQEGKQLACAFHPELTEDLRVHRYFLDMAGGAL